ncbi:MAG: endonuclease/exonuclease/phosphatase family protein [Chitinophagales bacterium]|nr:endonuclease/exonuclease/phosphatase family protein [Chitinophagales bacterium]
MTFFRNLLLIINVLFALCLIAGGVSIYVNPVNFWLFSFFGLFFPLWLIANFFFIFFWIAARFRYIVISILAVLLVLPAMQSYFAVKLFHPDSTASNPVKIMTYNVRNFDLYNWKQGDATKKLIMELINDQRPDIICFQEFFSMDTGGFATISELQNRLGYPYYRFEKTVERGGYGAWGVATFSRYPIIGSSSIRFSNSKFNSSLYTDVKVDSSVIRIFNAHLQSVYLSAGDYEYLEHVTEDQDVQVKPTRKILSKLKSGFLARSQQAVRLKEEIRKSPYPVIICGDFNDTPSSFTYHTLVSDLNDAFIKAGFGISPTYSGFLTPFRIDFVFTDQKINVVRYKTICEKLSDHYPVLCTIGVKGN